MITCPSSSSSTFAMPYISSFFLFLWNHLSYAASHRQLNNQSSRNRSLKYSATLIQRWCWRGSWRFSLTEKNLGGRLGVGISDHRTGPDRHAIIWTELFFLSRNLVKFLSNFLQLIGSFLSFLKLERPRCADCEADNSENKSPMNLTCRWNTRVKTRNSRWERERQRKSLCT